MSNHSSGYDSQTEMQIIELAEAFEDARLLLPAGPVLDRLERVVAGFQVVPLVGLKEQAEALAREIGFRQKKNIEIQCQGFDFAVVPSVHAALSLTLIHSVRNAVDHGITVSGCLTVSLSFVNGSVRLRVADDGAGLDFKKIRTRAVEMRLFDESAMSGLAPDEIQRQLSEILFLPDFSTRSEANEWSGRGIGLDAIRAAAARLGGQVGIAPGPGARGAVLELEIPVSMVAVVVNPGAPFCFVRNSDRSGAGVFRIFHRLDPVWKATGPEWLRKVFDETGGNVFVCKAGGATSGAFPFAVLTDS